MRKGAARRVRPEQEQIEDDAGAEAASKDEECHGSGTKQIPFAEMRQVVGGFATATLQIF
jgi:hypothetical protein